MLVVASIKFSIISLITSGRVNLFLPILTPKKGDLVGATKSKATLENQEKKGILLELPKANNIRKQGNKKGILLELPKANNIRKQGNKNCWSYQKQGNIRKQGTQRQHF